MCTPLSTVGRGEREAKTVNKRSTYTGVTVTGRPEHRIHFTYRSIVRFCDSPAARARVPGHCLSALSTLGCVLAAGWSDWTATGMSVVAGAARSTGSSAVAACAVWCSAHETCAPRAGTPNRKSHFPKTQKPKVKVITESRDVISRVSPTPNGERVLFPVVHYQTLNERSARGAGSPSSRTEWGLPPATAPPPSTSASSPASEDHWLESGDLLALESTHLGECLRHFQCRGTRDLKLF